MEKQHEDKVKLEKDIAMWVDAIHGGPESQDRPPSVAPPPTPSERQMCDACANDRAFILNHGLWYCRECIHDL